MFSVMTVNVGNGLARPERLAGWLRRSSVDIVGLQEVDERQAALLGQSLSDIYPWQVVYGTGFSGRGLLSRFPILRHEQVWMYEGRADIRATLTIRNCETTVIVAHPLPPAAGRRGIVTRPGVAEHIDALSAEASSGGPLILLGDFNMTLRHPLYRRLASAGLVDAFEAAGSGRAATFPVRPGKMRRVNHRLHWLPLKPVVRIDYIWHTADLESVACSVGPDIGSDHLPVTARLRPAARPDGDARATDPTML